MVSKALVTRLLAFSRLLLLAMVVCAGTGAGPMRAETIFGPHLTAMELRVARDAAFVKELQLFATRETGVQEGEKVSSREATIEKLRFGLGPDYVYIATDTTLTIFDYVLRRIFEASLEPRTFVSTSLYALIGFRSSESRNRQRLAKLGVRKGIDSPPIIADRFWRETSLGIIEDRNTKVLIEFAPTTDNYTLAMHDGQEIARFRFTDHRLSRDEQSLFQRLLWNTIPLHPDIIEQVVSTGRIPSEIVYKEYSETNHLVQTRVTIDRVERVNAGYPLSADFTVDLAGISDDPFVEQSLPFALAAISGEHGSGPPSVDSFTGRMRRALATDSILDAVLVWLELGLYKREEVDCRNQDNNTQTCSTIHMVASKSRSDTGVQPVIKAINPVKHGNSKLDGIRTLSSIPREGLSAGFLLDLFEANLLSSVALNTEDWKTKKQFEIRALNGFLSALKGNPYVGGIFKDTGDFYYYRFETYLAWLYWDLGRSIPGQAGRGNLDRIDKFEARLRRSHPEFF